MTFWAVQLQKAMALGGHNQKEVYVAASNATVDALGNLILFNSNSGSPTKMDAQFIALAGQWSTAYQVAQSGKTLIASSMETLVATMRDPS